MVVLTLSACGGGLVGQAITGGSGGGGSTGGGSSGGTGGGSTATYASLTDATHTTPITLRASGLLTNVSDGTISVDNGTGSLVPNTQSLTISDGVVTLTDTDGPNSAGVFQDASGATFAASTTLDTSSYDYLALGNLNYTSGGTTYDVAIVYGARTTPADLAAASGTVTYSGSATASAVSSTGNSYALNNGAATIEVDFGGDSVDVTLDNFTVLDGTTGLPTTAPFDTISIDNMTIASHGFEGGDITTTNGGTIVLFAGPSPVNSADGGFFALDGTTPDEVGGVFLSDGSAGTVQGIFIGD